MIYSVVLPKPLYTQTGLYRDTLLIKSIYLTYHHKRPACFHSSIESSGSISESLKGVSMFMYICCMAVLKWSAK